MENNFHLSPQGLVLEASDIQYSDDIQTITFLDIDNIDDELIFLLLLIISSLSISLLHLFVLNVVLNCEQRSTPEIWHMHTTSKTN